MDSPRNDSDDEPFFHLANPPSALSRDRPAFEFREDALPIDDFQPSRRNGSLTARSSSSNWLDDTSLSRRHRSSPVSGVGSTVYLTGELSSSRKELDMDSYNSVIVSAVERTMKNYADNILRVLEGMSGRLSKLESVTHNLEHSVASLKISVDEYHDEADGRLRALNNRVVEMHRAVQILRDKQDIVEVHAELAKLQSSHNEGSVGKSNALSSAANDTADPVQTPKHHQQQLTAHVANALPATYPSQLQLPSSHQQEPQAPNDSVVQQIQPSLSSSLNTTPQQYFSVQGESQQALGQMQQPLPALQQTHQPLPQSAQAQPQQIQAQAQHVQTRLVQQHSLQPQHMQSQQNMQQQAQVLQSLPQQGGMHQLQPHSQVQLLAQVPKSQPQLEHGQFQVVPQQMQMQQPLPQHGSSQQSLQQPHSAHSTPMHLAGQQIPAQISVQQPQVQQSPSGHVQVPFQQFSHQNENQSYSHLPQGALVQAPYGQGGYVAESSYGAANISSSQQQLSSNSSQRPIQLAPQNYGSPSRNSLPSTPTQPSYDANVAGNYNAPINWNAQSTAVIPNMQSRLPVAQPVLGGNLPPNKSPLDEVVDKVVAMGFSREQVRTVIRSLTERGQSVDMNVVLDILMNGSRENQGERVWQGR